VKFTRCWIEEFIQISDSDESIAQTLNEIGHEVASVEYFKMPQKTVVGKVIECVKHPDASKLSVCKVDVGNEILQIVCGASNVKKDIFVAVALVGAKLSDLKLKPVKLRGIDSFGMICSSSELGFPETNDGIMILDQSLGKLEPGISLQDIKLLNDTLFEIEPTANRGDVLSINGIARELSAACGYRKKPFECHIDDDNAKGIGRVLQVDFENNVDANLMYKVIDTEELKSNFLIDLRLALVEESAEKEIDKLLKYTTHSTGVLIRAYDFNGFYDQESQKAYIKITKDNKINRVKTKDLQEVELLGIEAEKEFLATKNSKMTILEAYYVDPESISIIVHKNKLKTDDNFYRSSRGSEPNLEKGICFFCDSAKINTKLVVYSEKIQYKSTATKQSITCRLDDVNALIGKDFEKIEINSILKSLGMEVRATPEQYSIMVETPIFRHDLKNSADIIEEIVRIHKIDNIQSKPLVMEEVDIFNNDYMRYKFQMQVINKLISVGFSQSLNFVFTDSKNLKKFNLKGVKDSLELLTLLLQSLIA
jgi:phenylalanyl-tRNA synthetase beta chain